MIAAHWRAHRCPGELRLIATGSIRDGYHLFCPAGDDVFDGVQHALFGFVQVFSYDADLVEGSGRQFTDPATHHWPAKTGFPSHLLPMGGSQGVDLFASADLHRQCL